jgi:hypothetical protein
MRVTACLLEAAWGVLLVTASTSAQVNLTKIADSNTAIPGSTGTFAHFGDVSFDGTSVAFAGSGSGQKGVYTNAGGSLGVVADLNSTIPGGTDTFTDFAPWGTSIDGGVVTFEGSGAYLVGPPGPRETGIYINAGGTLAVVADMSTPVPGQTGTFLSVSYPKSDSANVLFRGYYADGDGTSQGLYMNVGGTLNVVADATTPIPGGTEQFREFPSYSIDGENVAFEGRGYPDMGIYTTIGGSLQVVADTSTPIPGGSGTFTGELLGPVLSNGNVAFLGEGGSSWGIYTTLGGSLRPVADWNTSIPGSTESFVWFSYPALDGDIVAFLGGPTTIHYEGVYAEVNGSLMTIVDRNDLLDGKEILDFWMGEESLVGDTLAFGVEFVDNSRAIYLATIPEPATLILLALGGVAALRRRRHGR